ncbi:MAG: hemolysin family protein [Anaerolineae bacterium]
MDPSSSYWIELIFYGVFLAATALAASGETAVTSLNRIRLQASIDRGDTRAEAIRGIIGDPRQSLASLLVLNTLGLLGGAVTATLLAFSVSSLVNPYIITFALLALVLLVQFLSKAIALRSPDRTALLIARPLHILAVIFSPIVRFLGFLATGATSDKSVDMLAREEELRLLVDVGEEEGLIEEQERDMIAGVFDLGDTVAREVMVPRIDIVALDMETPLQEVLNTIIECGHSRLPVYEENIDQVAGVLYAKDLLRALRDIRGGGAEPSLRDLLRPAYFIPETKPVDDLLAELKRIKVHLAVVVDEYGGTAGLVTIEDLLEEIVGEIQDEYDTEEPISQTISAQEIIYDARANLDDLNEELDLHLPTGENDTLGGLIFSQLGRVPEVGDEVQVENVRLIVLTVHGRRIGKVRIKIEESRPGTDDGDRARDGASAAASAQENEEEWQTTRKINGTA